MGLWTVGATRDSDVKRSGELCKQRDALEAKRGEIQRQWNEVDIKEVMPLAEELSVLMFAQNGARILETRQKLQQAIHKRDGLLEAHSRQVDSLNAEIEILSGPTIYENVRRWQEELLGLRDRRAIEIDDKYRNLGGELNPVMYTLKSNFEALAQARAGLLEGIHQLRAMQCKPLGDILRFVEEHDKRLKKIDLTAMRVGEPMPQSVYMELVSEPGLQVIEQRGVVSRYFKQ